MAGTAADPLGYLKSTFPVLVPEDANLFHPQDKFLKVIKDSLAVDSLIKETVDTDIKDHDSDQSMQTEPLQEKILTANYDPTFATAGSKTVDLFFELEDTVDGARLVELFPAAWAENAETTLKLIFNARSIHIGKGSRHALYKGLGFLATSHPFTLVSNLHWLVRPMIKTKLDKKATEDGEDMVMVEPEPSVDVPSSFDIQNGGSHGYFKDLLSVLVLAVNDELKADGKTRETLKSDSLSNKERTWDEDDAKSARADKLSKSHDKFMSKFTSEAVYRSLHMEVARIFAEYLKQDLVNLKAGQTDKSHLQKLSLAAKWAPSAKGFHDKHTFVTSSIAEIMHPRSTFTELDGETDRATYLRHAREAYRKDVSALRKALAVVERDITAETFSAIDYQRVPSFAMRAYTPLFGRKDQQRFTKYLMSVTEGRARMSGATLLPSQLVRDAYNPNLTIEKSYRGIVAMQQIVRMSIDNQWRSLVQRVRDSGTLESCIAVCDVSGSMLSPTFADKTTPIDSSVGLSLLVAEVTKPPFNRKYITFSSHPTMETIGDDSVGLYEKVKVVHNTNVGYSTNLIAVFENLLLPFAVAHKVKQEDMVKRVYVFSDMHFDAAQRYESKWESSFERVQRAYAKAGYEMPKLVFWNLAGSRTGSGPAPKPVQGDENGVSLVSGFSQGMLKMFMESSVFGEQVDEDEQEDAMIEEKVVKDGEVVVTKHSKEKESAYTTMMKAISHRAYSMLRVVD